MRTFGTHIARKSPQLGTDKASGLEAYISTYLPVELLSNIGITK